MASKTQCVANPGSHSTYRSLPIQHEENRMVEWLRIQRIARQPVSHAMFKRKMVRLVRQKYPQLTMFTASRFWTKGFLRRHALTLRRITTSGRPAAADSVQVLDKFYTEFDCIKRSLNLMPSQILAMGEATHFVPGGAWCGKTARDKVECMTCVYTAASNGARLSILAGLHDDFSQIGMPRQFYNITTVQLKKGICSRVGSGRASTFWDKYFFLNYILFKKKTTYFP